MCRSRRGSDLPVARRPADKFREGFGRGHITAEAGKLIGRLADGSGIGLSSSSSLVCVDSFLPASTPPPTEASTSRTAEDAAETSLAARFQLGINRLLAILRSLTLVRNA